MTSLNCLSNVKRGLIKVSLGMKDTCFKITGCVCLEVPCVNSRFVKLV